MTKEIPLSEFKPVVISLNVLQINTLVQLLQTLPYNKVAGLIPSIIEQVQPQMDAQAAQLQEKYADEVKELNEGENKSDESNIESN